ncbi:restriction endonuclease [Thermococcus sp.]
MTWTPNIVRKLSRDDLLDRIAEVLNRMGFKNYEKVASREKWGIDMVAIRDDPIAGTEKLLIKVHTGSLASSKDVNVFGDLIDKYKADRGILVSPLGFTKDARSAVAKEYRGRIILWDAEKIAKMFSNYGLDVPEIQVEEEKEDNKSPLMKFELDAPLLFEFSPEAVVRRISEEVSKSYPIKPEEIKLASLKVYLSTAYIISWSVEEKEKDKALVFSKDNIKVRTSSDPKLATPIKKALLNDKSEIYATEREIITPLSPSESVLLLKGILARDFNVPEGSVKIHERKKVYVPEKAEAELKVGANHAKAEVDLMSGKVKFEIKELPDEYFLEKTRKTLAEMVGEEPVEIAVKRDGWKVKVKGKTQRFNFEFKFNGYTGAVLHIESLMSDEAVEELIKSVYPGGNIINVEKGKKFVVADVALDKEVVIVEINLQNGKIREITRLPSPEEAFEKAKSIIEGNFPVEDLKLVSSRVLEHKFLELVMEGKGGRATVKIDGATKDVLDYVVEITPEKAGEIVLGKYDGYKTVKIVDSGDAYTVEIENNEYNVTVEVSKDGKIIKETDRALKKEVAQKIAEERIKNIDETAELKSIELKENWIAEFQGSTKGGRIVLDRKSGEILEEDVRFTELALEDLFHRHLREQYGEENLRTERLTHYKEEGYIHIKVTGKNGIYYARIDTKTGNIISEDKAPLKGIAAKLKQFQLESKYK